MHADMLFGVKFAELERIGITMSVFFCRLGHAVCQPLITDHTAVAAFFFIAPADKVRNLKLFMNLLKTAVLHNPLNLFL